MITQDHCAEDESTRHQAVRDQKNFTAYHGFTAARIRGSIARSHARRARAIATNQTAMIGPKRRADLRRPESLHEEDADEDDERHDPDPLRDVRRDDAQSFHCAEHRDGRRDHPVAVQQRRAEDANEDEKLSAALVRVATLLLEDEREERHHSALAAVVCAHDERDVLHRDDDDRATRESSTARRRRLSHRARVRTSLG